MGSVFIAIELVFENSYYTGASLGFEKRPRVESNQHPKVVTIYFKKIIYLLYLKLAHG